MASSRVMASLSSAAAATAADLDLARHSVSAPLHPPTVPQLQSLRSVGTVSMDDILHNIYGDGGGETDVESPQPPLWQEIVAGRKMDDGDGSAVAAAAAGVTLEDFLARTGVVMVEDIRASSGVFAVEQPVLQPVMPPKNPIGNGEESGGGEQGVGRGRKRPALDPVDRAALQRQKRMIKNRESAARSRERKQAYTRRLEGMISQLEEENALLIMEQEEQKRQRLKQLMENLIPVTEMKRPPRALRRTQSMQW